MAGNALAYNNKEIILHYIVLFFIMALLAYFLSSYSAFIQLKFKNNLWQIYANNLFKDIKFNLKLSSESNKHLTSNWLTGEAQTTFDTISTFSIDMFSVYCNVIFTFAVFYVSLGVLISGAMAISIIISLILLKILKLKISKLATNIQSTRLKALVNINLLWDAYLYGSEDLINSTNQEFNSNLNAHFLQAEKYQIIEQIIACLPIYIVVPFIIIAMYYSTAQDSLVLGGVVAVLPRSLQLLGNVHSLSMYNSKVILMKYKLKNLETFVLTLKQQDLQAQIKLNQITIKDVKADQYVSFNELLMIVMSSNKQRCRILIQGANGTGKSTLLRILKNSNPKLSVLLSPGVTLVPNETNASTGEQLIKQLRFILSNKNTILFLDEWDANLDSTNIKKIDTEINDFSKSAVVVEVRHRK